MVIDSPIGPLTIVVDEAGRLVELRFGVADVEPRAGCARVAAQLREYFDGTRRSFELELAPRGTDFQRAVWTELLNIPYGRTTSYAELARRIGRPSAIRAAGAANGANPIPLIVPCHRVIGANGTLTGYGGGLHRKQWLLEHETGQLALKSRR